MGTPMDDMVRLFELPQMPQMPQMPLAEAWRCIRFTDSVACLIAEGSEFMTKEQLYDAIKNVFSRIILKAGDKDCD